MSPKLYPIVPEERNTPMPEHDSMPADASNGRIGGEYPGLMGYAGFFGVVPTYCPGTSMPPHQPMPIKVALPDPKLWQWLVWSDLLSRYRVDEWQKRARIDRQCRIEQAGKEILATKAIPDGRLDRACRDIVDWGDLSTAINEQICYILAAKRYGKAEVPVKPMPASEQATLNEVRLATARAVYRIESGQAAQLLNPVDAEAGEIAAWDKLQAEYVAVYGSAGMMTG